ncbi:probable cytochrome P450 49a1 [Hyalella azteca]|uniref:Probable cytochrome P450 49a1 n=1 Tax=Hyalella azteca TaxID=294128 RepID=A0A8B7P3S6_HYAAZ|nr:probable cytochrome P450 49a1 [Hyalella azteca]
MALRFKNCSMLTPKTTCQPQRAQYFIRLISGNGHSIFNGTAGKFPTQQVALPSCALPLTVKNSLIFSASGCHRSIHEVATKTLNPKNFSDIPGPKPLPLIGNTLLFFTHKDFDLNNVQKFWESITREYGGIVKLKVFGAPTMVVTTSPDDVEILYKSTMEDPRRIGFECLKAVRDHNKDNFFNKKTGLLTEHGEEWWRVRSRVQAPLLRPRSVAMYLPAVDGATKKFMNRIDLLQEGTGQVPPDFLHELHKWALECVGLIALNRELGCLDPGLRQDSFPMQLVASANAFFNAATEAEIGFPAWMFYRTKPYVRLETHHDAFLALAIEAIKEAEDRLQEVTSSQDPHRRLSIMETLLSTDGLNRSDVATIILDLLLAGIETTANALGFTLYLLARHPQEQRRLQETVDSVVGDASAPLTPQHLAAIPGLGHVLRETLRLYPLVFGSSRILCSDVVMSGYRVPAGTLVLSLQSVISQQEEFFPEAKKFLPQRWDRDRPFGPMHPFASLPFSHGTRMCVGRRIAEQQIFTFLVRVLQKYTVRFEHQEEMRVKSQFTLKPETPLTFTFAPRA